MNGALDRPDVVVVGAGVIGLVTALRLRRSGVRVEVWTRDEPQRTTSAVAGAIWYPFLAEPRDLVAKWSAFTFGKLTELASCPEAGVRLQSVVEVFDHEAPELWWAEHVPDVERLPAHEVPQGFAAGVRAHVPVVDVPTHVRWLCDELRAQGVKIVPRTVQSLDEALAVAGIVVNCTGLGARELCGDTRLQAVRGQVLRLAGASCPHAWIDDTSGVPCYVIPRADGLIVGGTAQVGDERLSVDERDSASMRARAEAAFPQLRDAELLETRVGLRPYRSTVRLEREPCGAGVVIHNYGHGGSGYTVAWGCAEDVASLVTG